MFLEGQKGKNSGRSEARVEDRIAQGLRSDYPNSTKVGAGANSRVSRGYDVARKKAAQSAKSKPKISA